MASVEVNPNRNWNKHDYDEHAEVVQLALDEVSRCRQRGERPNLAAICRKTNAPYDKTRRRVLQQDAKKLRGNGTYKQAYLRVKKQLESQTRALQNPSLQNPNQNRSLEIQQYVPPRMPSPPTAYKGNGGYNKAMSDEQEQAVLEAIWQGIKNVSDVTQAMVLRIGDAVFARDHTDPNTPPRKASLP